MNQSTRLGSLVIAIEVGLLYVVPVCIWLTLFASGSSQITLIQWPFAATLWTTIKICLLSTMGSVAAAYPFLLLWFLSKRLREAILLVMIIPLVIGFLARNYAWIGILSTHTARRIAPDLLYSQRGVIIVMITVFLPTAFFVLLQGLAGVRADLIDAARVMGATERSILAFLILPLTFRSQLLAIVLNFAIALGYFITPRMIGGGKVSFVSTMILKLFESGNMHSASRVALTFLCVMIAPALALCWFALRSREREAGD